MKTLQPPVDKIDFSALGRKPTRQDIEWAREQIGKKKLSRRMRSTFIWLAVFGVFGVLLLESLAAVLLPAIMAIVIVVSAKKGQETMAAVVRFAYDNDLRYMHASPPTMHAGAIFGTGHSRVLEHVLHSRVDPDSMQWELGNYRYTTGSGKNAQTYHWGYACMQLPREMPHMMLDARENRLSAARLAGLAGTQKLKVSGEFDKYFTLYVPAGYERDALYVFTPDLMALLVDNSAKYDIEILGDKLYVYGRKLAITEESSLRDMFMVLDKVGERMLRRTGRYSDERMHAHEDRGARIHTDGAQLKRRSDWRFWLLASGIIVVALLILASTLSTVFR